MKGQWKWMGMLLPVAALVTGCASARTAKSAQAAAPAAAADASRPSAEPDVRELATQEIPELKAVRFGYDSDLLGPNARATLRANAEFLKAHPEMKVQVAGNCDQHGTVEYNLALGQRRAASVRLYYRRLGVEASRVATISYGKERLLCDEDTDACRSRNRRAATLEVLSPKVASRPAP